MWDKEHSRIIDYEVNKLLVEACKKNDVKKFIYASSMYVTRPNSLVAFTLNTVFANVFKWKLKTENAIRNSGLKYTIIRPGFLKWKNLK